MPAEREKQKTRALGVNGCRANSCALAAIAAEERSVRNGQTDRERCAEVRSACSPRVVLAVVVRAGRLCLRRGDKAWSGRQQRGRRVPHLHAGCPESGGPCAAAAVLAPPAVSGPWRATSRGGPPREREAPPGGTKGSGCHWGQRPQQGPGR
ncbi:hypothetical protein MTO96_009731 [Rhipicephalus appendiculatus]